MFDFSDVQDKDGHKQFITQERKTKTVASLHAILKPFLLRRVKADVETLLPKKREYILYAPLTAEQKELYRKIKDNDVRTYLEEKALEKITRECCDRGQLIPFKSAKRKAESEESTSHKSSKSSRASTPSSITRSRRKGKNLRNYTEISDREYFKKMEESSESEEIDEDEQKDQERAKNISLARKSLPFFFSLSPSSPSSQPSLQENKSPRKNYKTPSCNSALLATPLTTFPGRGPLYKTRTKRSSRLPGK